MNRRNYIFAPIMVLGMLSSTSFGAAAEKTLEDGVETATPGSESALVTMVSASASSTAPVSVTAAMPLLTEEESKRLRESLDALCMITD
jgi:H+/Cl- antiporter ClcA